MIQTHITATTLINAYGALLEEVVKEGMEYTVTDGLYAGQKRMELNFATVEVTRPQMDIMLLVKFCKLNYNYYLHYIKCLDETRRGKRSSFGDFQDANFDGRFLKHLDVFKKNFPLTMDVTPIGLLIQKLKDHGSGTSQACLQMADAEDIVLHPSPCFRVLDAKVIGKSLNLYCYFRSWDLLKEFPSDIVLLTTLMDYIGKELELNVGSLVLMSKGAHLYAGEDYCKAKELVISEFWKYIGEN